MIAHTPARARRFALAACAGGLTCLAWVQPASAQRLATPLISDAVADERSDASAIESNRPPRLAPPTGTVPAPTPAPLPATTVEPASASTAELSSAVAAERAAGFLRRPYNDSSPWNTRIGSSATALARSAAGISLIGGPITSDPSHYTYPLYFVDGSTPKVNVKLSGMYSNVTGTATADTTLTRVNGGVVQIPARGEFSPASGGDSQIIIVNPSTGDEWGFWRLKNSGGRWTATSGYHYNVFWDGHPPRDSSGFFGARGAGVPYFAGLIRPWEIRSGRIDHALAFAFGGNSWPSRTWVFPAAKSDGRSTNPNSLPEGARLQLDPRMTEAQLRAAGCSPAAIIMARAMQEYGMYVVDQSGSDKIMLEYSGTADWSSLGVTRTTASCIPLNRLRRVG